MLFSGTVLKSLVTIEFSEALPPSFLNICLTSYFLDQGIQPYTIPCNIFKSLSFIQPKQENLNDYFQGLGSTDTGHMSHDELINKKIEFMTSLITSKSKYYIGIDDTLVPSKSSQVGITSQGLEEDNTKTKGLVKELTVKYGSTTLARKALSKLTA